MSVEGATYVADLSPANPPSGDLVSQGDDHLRLIKSVLQATFPEASKAFRFPTASQEATATVNISFPADQNNLFPVNANAASRTVNLPDPTSGGTVNEDAFSVTVVRTDANASNSVTIVPAGAHTINGASSLVLSFQYHFVILIWD